MSPEHAKDAQLAKQVARGNQQALQELYTKYVPQAYSFIARLSPAHIDPQDIVQEAFIKAWQNIKKYDSQYPFRTWLFTIARNTLRDQIRKKNPEAFSRLQDNPDDPSMEDMLADEKQPHPSIEVDRQFDQAVLEKALQGLQPPQREAVLLHAVEDFTFQEISQTTQEPMDTVKTRYRRAIQALRRIISEKKA